MARSIPKGLDVEGRYSFGRDDVSRLVDGSTLEPGSVNGYSSVPKGARLFSMMTRTRPL